jgi:hypothetical protein
VFKERLAMAGDTRDMLATRDLVKQRLGMHKLNPDPKARLGRRGPLRMV